MNNINQESPYLIIVMGVSGSGKTSIAKALSKEYAIKFMEADDFHSDKAKKHMADGQPLSDEMRKPWINRMIQALKEGYKKNHSYVLSYSGLKAAHRQLFRELPFSPRVIFLFLDGEKGVLKERICARTNHFMPVDLLNSQFDALERPYNEPDVFLVPINHSLSNVLNISKDKINHYLL